MASTVLVFGVFDPLHEGHLFFLNEAKKYGDNLLVVVSSDAAISLIKKRLPFHDEKKRLEAVRRLCVADTVLLGEDDPTGYNLLSRLQFDAIALGYDQKPSDEDVIAELRKRGKEGVEVVRIPAYKPERFKSSFFRSSPIV